MEDLTKPQVISGPFAYNGQKNEIPDSPTGNAHASVQEGFPPITFLPEDDGGEAPYGQDFNGLGNLLSQFYFFTQNGGLYTFDPAVADTIGGYPENALLWYFPDDNNVTAKWLRSTKPNNTDNFITNPEVIGSSWVEQNNQQSILPPTSILTFDHPVDFGGMLPLNSADYQQGYLIENCDASYPDFWEKMLQFKNLGKTNLAYARYNKTQQEYSAELTANGFCGFYVIDETAKSVRLPYLGDAYLQGGASNAIDRSAGLPDITHTHRHRHGLPGTNSTSAGGGRILNLYGASDAEAPIEGYRQSSYDETPNSSVSPIYGKSDTVQTDSVGVFFYIVAANNWKDVSIEDFTSRLDAATDQDIERINTAAEASIAEAQSWAVGTIAERPEGSAKYWAESVNPDKFVRPGTIIMYPLSSLDGYLPCNGAAVSRTAYADLYNVIGTTYGTGDGETTFNLPDFRGDFIRGYLSGTSAEIGQRQAEGLPNITGGPLILNVEPSTPTPHGAVVYASRGWGLNGGTSAYAHIGSFDATQANAIYGSSPNVTPRNQALNFFIKY